MKKLLEYLLVCTLLCAAIAGPSTAFADVCKVYGSQHQYTEEGYEALHPHKEYVACKCGFADYTGSTRILDTEEGYEAEHPHKEYVKCKCGWADYTGGTRILDNCPQCSEDSGPAHTPDDPEDETCAHTTKIKINTQIVDYQQTDVINASTHHAIIHTYSWQCTDCQKTFDPITELMCYAAHNFNSQGVCKECNYCTHTNIRKEYLDGGKVVNKDDYYHHYIENPYKGSCDYCGTVITGVDEEPELHEYDRDGWCFCGYYNEDYCPHNHTKLRDAGYGYGVDGSITETRHFTEHCYEEYCFDCNTIIGSGWEDSGEGNPWWEGYWEDHSFDDDGYCVCGYYQEPEVCSHENSELRLTDTTYSMDETDAEMHWAQYNYDVYCFDCKQVVSTTWEGQGEYHVFNENGYCSACGFQKDPDENMEPLQVSISVWKQDAMVGDRVGADATVSGGSGNYTYHWEASSNTQKYIQSGSNYTHRSWGYNANSACTWKIKVTVTDEETGEQKSATTTGIKVSEAVIEIQSLKCNKGTQGWELGDQLTFQAVVKGGSGNYQIAWKVTKDGNIVKEDNFSANEKFAFVIDETGYWQVTAIATDVQNNGDSEAATRGETVSIDERYEYMVVNLDYDALCEPVDKKLFDYTDIKEVIYLNCSTGASMIGQLGGFAYLLPYNNAGNAGHTGMLLVDEKGQSVYFSCNGNPVGDYANFVLRYLSADETERFLNGDGLGDCDSYPLQCVVVGDPDQKRYFQIEEENGELVLNDCLEGEYTYFTPDSTYGMLEWIANEKLVHTLPLGRFDGDDVFDYLEDNVNIGEWGMGVFPITGVSNHQLLTSDTYVYDNAIGMSVSRAEGVQMYLQALDYFNGDEKYDFMEKNCDYYVLDIMGLSSIVTAEQEEYLKDRYLPNKVYSKLESAATDPSRFDLPENVLRIIK